VNLKEERPNTKKEKLSGGSFDKGLVENTQVISRAKSNQSRCKLKMYFLQQRTESRTNAIPSRADLSIKHFLSLHV
jgi:hypothetical protein